MTIIQGFYGKFPQQGDFIRHELPLDWCTEWHQWLQSSLAVSQEQLGAQWEDLYLTSPLWRFSLQLGSQACIGVMMPSVDSAGRYFPLALMATGQFNPWLNLAQNSWFEQAESIVLSALNEDASVQMLQHQTMNLGLPQSHSKHDAELKKGLQISEQKALSGSQMIKVLGYANPSMSLWWSAGSDTIESCYLIQKSLPDAASFSAFLDGQWAQWDWLELN